MKPGIFYLYEYNNSQKLRNAGFLKITRYYHSCTLMLNARGIPVAYSDTIKLCAFYLENDLANSAVLAEITCTNHAFSARLNSAESRFPDGRTLDMIDGFFLPLPNGHVLAAAAPGIAVDTGKLLAISSGQASPENESADNSPERNRNDSSSNVESRTGQSSSDGNVSDPFNELEAESIDECSTSEGIGSAASNDIDMPGSAGSSGAPEQEPRPVQPSSTEPDCLPDQEFRPEQPSAAEPECQPDQESRPIQPSVTEPECQPDQESRPEQPSTAEPECQPNQESRPVQPSATEPDCPPGQGNSTGQSPQDGQSQPPHSGQDTSQNQESSAEQAAPSHNVRKIQRSEMSILPRKYWHIANNSFLLHGYHNYHHLLLIEKDGHYWLGVPGIYDPREARAARLFGFPQFTDSYNDSLQLSDDECSPQENFGYWCCFLK